MRGRPPKRTAGRQQDERTTGQQVEPLSPSAFTGVPHVPGPLVPLVPPVPQVPRFLPAPRRLRPAGHDLSSCCPDVLSSNRAGCVGSLPKERPDDNRTTGRKDNRSCPFRLRPSRASPRRPKKAPPRRTGAARSRSAERPDYLVALILKNWASSVIGAESSTMPIAAGVTAVPTASASVSQSSSSESTAMSW